MARSNSKPQSTTTANLLRLLALAGLALVFITYQPGSQGLLQTLLLPAVALISAWWLTGSVVAVALTAGLLSWAHANPGGSGFIEAVLYPAVALTATLVVLATLVLRFRRAVLARRAQRHTQSAPESRGNASDSHH